MDRARGAGAGRDRRGGPAPEGGEDGGRLTIRRAALAAAWILALPGPACTNLTSDLKTPVAIQFVTLPNPAVEVGDTLRLAVTVLDRTGDSVPGAAVSLVIIDTTFLSLDSAHLAVIGRAPADAANIVAVSGSLRSDRFAIKVPAGHADSLALAGPSAVTVAAADSASGPLSVSVLDLTTAPGTTTPLGSRPVRFTIVQPAFHGLDSATVALRNDSLAMTATTAAGGAASVVVKRRGTLPQPDSVVVEAAALRGTVRAVRGSPVRFVVRFQ